MSPETSARDPRAHAVCAALAPYGWRALTAEMVARRLLGAVDRLLVLEVIGAGPSGSVAGELAAVEPVERTDQRIEPLMHLLASVRWREATLTRLVPLLLDALDQWWLRRDAFERELSRLLDEQPG